MRKMVALTCAACGITFERVSGTVTYRLRRFGPVPVFCSMACSGKARRDNKPLSIKRAEKRAYDTEYRKRNAALLAEKKRHYYQHVRKADPERERQVRAARMPYHVEYCRRYYADPTRLQAKKDYDLNRRAAEYGSFGDAYKLLLELEREVRRLSPNKYERLKAKGYYIRTAQQRRRDAGIAR